MEPVFNVVLPVFAIILAGYLVGRFGVLGEESTGALNGFVYYVALPVLLFHSMATADPADILNWPFIAAFAGASLVTFVFSIPIARILFKQDMANTALFSMNAIWGNTGYMGIPLAIVAFGSGAGLPAIVATVYQSVIIIGLVTMMIEASQSQKAGKLGILRDIISGVIRNPLVVSSFLGVCWAFTGWEFPGPVNTFAEIMGPAAGPCALFSLGLFLVGKPLSEGASEVSAMVLIKLLIQPALTWWLAFHVFEVETLLAIIAVLMAALPNGATGFVMAKKYGVYVLRTSAATLISTVLAVITLSILFNLPGMQL